MAIILMWFVAFLLMVILLLCSLENGSVILACLFVHGQIGISGSHTIQLPTTQTNLKY